MYPKKRFYNPSVATGSGGGGGSTPNAIIDKGNWDASGGTLPVGTDRGWLYYISVAGTVYGVDLVVGATITSRANGAGQTWNDWATNS